LIHFYKRKIIIDKKIKFSTLIMSGFSLGSNSLIVTTLRLPFVTHRKEGGGVGRTESRDEWSRNLAHIVAESGGQWVGWPGPALQKGQQVPEADSADSSSPTAKLSRDQVVPVFLTQGERDLAYSGCCKSGFWPLFHSMADRAVFDEEHWDAYRKINHTFAEETLGALRAALAANPQDVPLIWIHDYHLMEVGNIVRRLAAQDKLACRIGFFMHIPFPSWDMVKIHPWKDIFLQGILGSDLVGFQCEDYALNFIECCERGLGTRVDRKNKLVEHGAGGRSVKIRAFPLGIPFQHFVNLANEVPPAKWDKPEGALVIFSVDTVDFTKGLLQKINGFERLLEKYHIHRESVVLVQACLPSRTEEGQQLREMLEHKVHSVNSKYSTATWTPIQLITRPLYDKDLASLYRDCDIAMVTPLRDGMNLTGKEFVACRINPENPGVLILSLFVGAADLMQEALLVNPYEVNKVADYLHNAIAMSTAEAEVRMVALRAREKERDINHWMNSFFQEVNMSEEQEDDLAPVRRSRTATMDRYSHSDFNDKLGPYLSGTFSRVCLLLDYDGTLAPHGSHPDLTVLPPPTKQVLQRLADMPEVFVSVITGRCLPDIKAKVGIKNITYAGNHGIDIVQPDGTKFVPPMPEEIEEKARWLLQKLQEECAKEGAWVENKGIVLAFHHEAWKEKGSIDPALKESLLSRARQLMTEAGFKIGMSDGGLVTEAKPAIKWDKGNAAIHILRSSFGVDWSDRIKIIFAGDDLTDEDAMKALKGLAYNFRVVNSGLVQTLANQRLPDTKGILVMLLWLEKFILSRREKGK